MVPRYRLPRNASHQTNPRNRKFLPELENRNRVSQLLTFARWPRRISMGAEFQYSLDTIPCCNLVQSKTGFAPRGSGVREMPQKWRVPRWARVAGRRAIPDEAAWASQPNCHT